MNLKEALLLEGKTYENYYKEKKDGIIKPVSKLIGSASLLRRYITGSDPTATADMTGNYSDWIIRQLGKEASRISGGENKLAARDWLYWRILQFKTPLEFFDKNKKAFKFQDINKYSIKELEKEMGKLQEEKTTRKMKGGKAAFEHGDWKIIEIKNHQMACNLGSGSKWCITGRDYPEQFHKYKKFGPIFFVVKGNRRWAVTGGVHKYDTVYNVWDEKDKVIESRKWKTESSVPREVHLYLIKRYHNEAPEWGDGE